MAQHDYVIANGTGAAVRSDLNGSLAAIVSNNSGATEPTTMYAYQWWADTTTGLLKLRNSANNAWITLRELDGTLTIEDGTAAAPGLAFTSDLNTGLFRVGADQVAISTGGTSRLAVSTTAVSSTLAVDVTLGAVGTPSLTFTGDLNTGIYSPGADQVAITTAGVQRVNFNAATEVVFNDGGADVDFRIEGDTNANLFKIDAGLDEVQVANLNGGPIAGTRNRIINGDMRIDQRNAGAAVSINGYFPVDRWSFGKDGGTVAVSRSTLVPAGFTNSLLFSVTTGYTPTSAHQNNIRQFIEGFNVADLGWGAAGAQSITLSFWVRSSLTGTFSGSLMNSAYDRSYVFTFSVAAANTWEYKTVTIAGDTTGTWLADNSSGIRLFFDMGSGSSYNATAGAWGAGEKRNTSGSVQPIGTSGATFYITGVQLEPGTVATPFERRSYGQELALCQRYYQRTTAETASATLLTGVICSGASSGNGGFNLIGIMRTTPTLDSSTASAFAYSDGATGTACTAVSLAGSQSNSKIASINFSTAGSLTQFRSYRIEANSSTTAFLGFSSEL